MKTIKLNSEYEIPVIGLGTWRSATGEVYQALRWAIKLGYQHIDCAHIYGNETEIGQAITDAINEKDIRRDQLFITSKLWNDSHRPEDVIPALKQSLHDLQLEYLDLYLIHWPVAQQKGTSIPNSASDMISLKETPLETTWKEMENAKKMGLVRSIGVSNFGIKNLTSLIEKSEIIPSVNQIEHHPLLAQNELIEFCNHNGIVITAYSPLGSQQDTENTHCLLNNTVVKDIAVRTKSTPAQVLLAWALNKGVVVIPKSVHFERIKENFASLSLNLDDEDIQKLNQLDEGYRFIDASAFAYGDYTSENIFA